eukprot:SAG31_NODE_453_length_15464_cov_37.074064_17_plen_392_part_00
MFPENAGYYAWVSEAFGPLAGFFESWCSWFSGAIDNAIYPALLIEYVTQIFPTILPEMWQQLVVIGVLNILLTYLNWRGLEVVGQAAIYLVLISVSPFVAMAVVALPHLRLARLGLAPAASKINWGKFLNTLMWNLNYWDSAATLAGEVENPGRTYPKALALCVLLVWATYTVPIAVGCAATDWEMNGELWSNGYFSVIAHQIGGAGLSAWLLVAAALANIGLYMAEMSSDSFSLAGLAERGALPAAFGRRSRHGTPTLAIFASFCGCMVVGVLDVEAIIEATNFLYIIGVVLEFAAFCKLRVTPPKNLPAAGERFVVPCGTVGCVALLLPAASMMLVVTSFASKLTLAIAGIIALSAFPVYFVLSSKCTRRCCHFNGAVQTRVHETYGAA